MSKRELEKLFYIFVVANHPSPAPVVVVVVVV
jgi:hypothetical protein